MSIEVLKIKHKGEYRIGLKFPFNRELIDRVKKRPDARWSQTLKMWHVPDNQAIESLLKELHEKQGTEGIKSNIVATGTTIPKPTKKDVVPQTPLPGVKLELTDRKIIIRQVKLEADIAFVRSLRFSRWLQKERVWVVPDYP